MKIHTSRSMASTINTSRNDSFFSFGTAISTPPRRSTVAGNTLAVGGGSLMAIYDTLSVGYNTLTVNGGSLMIGDGTLAVGGGSLTAGDDTLAVGGGTLMVGGVTLMSDGQHQLNNVIACMTR
jgi:hypothetical protein